MPMHTTHHHSDETGTYDVDVLSNRAKGRKHTWASLTQMKINRSKASGFSKDRYNKVDMSKPIMIFKGRIIDGRHRAAKAEDEGRSHIKAIDLTPDDMSKAKVDAAEAKTMKVDKKYAFRDKCVAYANKPITKPGVRLLGKSREGLPETWVQDYEDTLRALSKLNVEKPADAARAVELNRFLDKLEAQARRAGRKGIYRPKPGNLGIYPDMVELPHDAIKRAVRANTGGDVSKASWDQVAASAKAFHPHKGESVRIKRLTGMDTLQQRNFMEAAAVALPIGKGREPRLLGEKVPGEVNMGPTGTRSIQGKGAFSSSDWSRGFSPMKFARTGKSRMGWAKFKWGTKKDAVISAGKGMLMTAVAFPVVGTPGYLTGFHTGRKRDLTPEEIVNRRVIPGYMEGYMQSKLLARARAKQAQPTSFSNADQERYYYEAGFMEGLKDKWDSFKRKVQGNIVPSMTRGAFVGGLGKLHQETNLLPPTTVDGIPVSRRSMDSTFAPFSTKQLMATAANLKKKEGKSGFDQDSVDDVIKDIEKEIMMRRGLPST